MSVPANPCALCGVDLNGNEGHGHGAAELEQFGARVPARTEVDELALALSSEPAVLVVYVKKDDPHSKRLNAVLQAGRDANAWLMAGHDFDITLERPMAAAPRALVEGALRADLARLADGLGAAQRRERELREFVRRQAEFHGDKVGNFARLLLNELYPEARQ